LRGKLGLHSEPVILHVTPSFVHPIKGGKYVVELAKNHPEWKFVIVGFDGDRKILPHNVIAISRVENQKELAQYYSMADITLLTSQRETFSMVCAESLCCGTPVVGFEAGGPETIAISKYSRFVEQGCIKQLEDAIQEMLTDKVIVDDVLARRIYNSETMANDYLQLYKGIRYGK
jgi:glycosyltransferase involved in cell wall biosynthesis